MMASSWQTILLGAGQSAGRLQDEHNEYNLEKGCKCCNSPELILHLSEQIGLMRSEMVDWSVDQPNLQVTSLGKSARALQILQQRTIVVEFIQLIESPRR